MTINSALLLVVCCALTGCKKEAAGPSAVAIEKQLPPPPVAGQDSLQLPQPRRVFPRAEGYGTNMVAGSTGRVIRVINLNDDGPGSFRAAVMATGPRTIVFEVSGNIELNRVLEFTSGDLTIAGQTAPSPGITLIPHAGFSDNQLFAVRGDRTLIQHIRVRGSDEAQDPFFLGVPPGGTGPIVVDHVSVSWGYDESVSGGTSPLGATISNSIISEALDPGGKGFLLTDRAEQAALIRNLFIHNTDRNPNLKGGSRALLLNNLIYNGGLPNRGLLIAIADGNNQGPQEVVLLGNVAKEGPTSEGNGYVQWFDTVKPGSQTYAADNIFGDCDFIFGGSFGSRCQDGIIDDSRGNLEHLTAPPFPLPDPLTVLPSASVEAHIVQNVGARPADRDSVDTSLIADVVNGTGQHVLSGTPPIAEALAENFRQLVLPDRPFEDDNGDGYTNLEAWLYVFTECVEGRWPDPTVCRGLQLIP